MSRFPAERRNKKDSAFTSHHLWLHFYISENWDVVYFFFFSGFRLSVRMLYARKQTDFTGFDIWGFCLSCLGFFFIKGLCVCKDICKHNNYTRKKKKNCTWAHHLLILHNFLDEYVIWAVSISMGGDRAAFSSMFMCTWWLPRISCIGLVHWLCKFRKIRTRCNMHVNSRGSVEPI